jgi:predicted acylesterase/phospholipase RssA
MTTESGGVIAFGPVSNRPPKIPAAPPSTTPFIDGAIASATMPRVFPARRLGDHMCVDGGVKEVVPVQIAVNHLGCNQVFALRWALSRYGRWPRRAAHWPTSGRDTGRFAPRLERLRSKEAVGASRDEVTRNGKDVVGGRVQGQEPLG